MRSNLNCKLKIDCSNQFCLNSRTCLHEDRFDFPRRVYSLIRIGHDAFCACCSSIKDLTFDHIIPTSKGGSNHLQNGQILCRECNEIKSDLIISLQDLRLMKKYKENEKSNRLH